MGGGGMYVSSGIPPYLDHNAFPFNFDTLALQNHFTPLCTNTCTTLEHCIIMGVKKRLCIHRSLTTLRALDSAAPTTSDAYAIPLHHTQF